MVNPALFERLVTAWVAEGVERTQIPDRTYSSLPYMPTPMREIP